MTQQGSWLAVLLALSLSGCGRQAVMPPSQSVAPAVAVEGFDMIRLERHACFETCPVYAVELGRDGMGSFVGKEHVRTKGPHRIQLDAADIALMSSVLNRSGFWSLKERYESKKDGCEAVWTDQSGLSISVVRHGKTRTVTFYHGCRGPAIPADALNWLADTIDYLANTRPLVFDPNADK